MNWWQRRDRRPQLELPSSVVIETMMLPNGRFLLILSNLDGFASAGEDWERLATHFGTEMADRCGAAQILLFGQSVHARSAEIVAPDPLPRVEFSLGGTEPAYDDRHAV